MFTITRDVHILGNVTPSYLPNFHLCTFIHIIIHTHIIRHSHHAVFFDTLLLVYLHPG